MTEFKEKIKIHEQLLNDVERAHIAKGYTFKRIAFHDYIDVQTQRMLINPLLTSNPAIAYFRAMPDAFTFNSTSAYYIDCKTVDNYRDSNIPNLAIELISYATDYDMIKYGIRTFVPIRYPPPYNIEKGFWIDESWRFRPNNVIVPMESKGTEKEKNHMKMARSVFGKNALNEDIQPLYKNCKSDSGDLFILIWANMILAMKDWKELIVNG